MKALIVALYVVLAVPAVVFGIVVGPIWWLTTSAWRVLIQDPIEVRVVQ